MATGLAEKPRRECRTICLPVFEDEYRRIVDDAQQFRTWMEGSWAEWPELFPEDFSSRIVEPETEASQDSDVALAKNQLERWKLLPNLEQIVHRKFLILLPSSRYEALGNANQLNLVDFMFHRRKPLR